jgi:two-component system, response regulator RegA
MRNPIDYQIASLHSFLVVDDDESLTAVLSRALRRRGFSTTAVQTAVAAIGACQEQIFDKAVVDLKLATSSGLQLIPQLLAIQPALQIVMLTGYSSIATAVEAIKLGAHNYLCKPADVDDILAAFSPKTGTERIATEDLSPPSVDRLEWEHIQRVLQEHDGNISATARALGMHRRTLQRKLNKRPVRR